MVDKCKSKKISTVMREFKKGSLKTGSKKKVKNPKQAIAIALNVANKKCSIKKSTK